MALMPPQEPNPPIPGLTTLSSFVNRPTRGYTGQGQVNGPKPFPQLGGPSPGARDSGGSESYPNIGQPGQGSTPTTPTVGPGTGQSPAGGNSPYNLDTDPIVQKIKALNAANYGTAVAGAQAGAKNDLIQSGFNFQDILSAHPELAQGIIGSVLADTATQLAAQQNPFSTAANLAHAHEGNMQNIDQTANAANLYYSSARGNNLGNEARTYLGNVDQAQTALGTALSGLLGNVASEKATEDQKLADAYDTARTNAINNAISSGETFAGYDANGNPIFSPAGTSSSGLTVGPNQPVAGNLTSRTIPAAALQQLHGAPGNMTSHSAAASALAAALLPHAVAALANKTGASAGKTGGVFSIH